MPRRTPMPTPDALGAELPERLYLPVAQPTHHRETWEDPLKPMVGSSTASDAPKRGRPRKDDPRSIAKAESKRLGERYDRYIDTLIATSGDKQLALSVTFEVPMEEAGEKMYELHAEVMKGLGSSSFADILKNQDLTKSARVALLRRHAFSTNPAASLKAIDMLGELDNDKHDQVGRYEAYLQLAMAEKA